MGQNGEYLCLTTLNNASGEAAQAMILPFTERAPWLATRVAANRPFDCPQALSESIQTEIAALNEQELVRLFRGHPDLAPANPDHMAKASQHEQARLGLTDPTASLAARFTQLNQRYSTTFGFPFIVALHRFDDLNQVLALFETCLTASRNAEIQRASTEIALVSRARILAAFAPCADPTE